MSQGEGIPAALIKKNFLFCLCSSCAVIMKNQRSERAKLGTLGVDNRSTATTILAVRALIELQADTTLRPEARSLLSFTDNCTHRFSRSFQRFCPGRAVAFGAASAATAAAGQRERPTGTLPFGFRGDVSAV